MKKDFHLSGIKKLAGQTLWYGAPNMLSRFLSYGLSLLGFRIFDPAATSDLTQVYAIIPFLNILFTYGLETSYFRFAQRNSPQVLYNTLNLSIIVSAVLFTVILFAFKTPIMQFLELGDKPQYMTWMIWIVFFDTLSVIPLAKLRLDERPRKYALVKMGSVVFNVLVAVFFLFVAKDAYEQEPTSILGALYDPAIGVGYFIIANLAASIVTLLFLYKEISVFRPLFDFRLWKEVMHYSYPLVIVGFGGMINEMLSRVIYKKVLHNDPLQEERELGIFGANYKLAVLITIFIQIFRLGAEPFFFNQSKNEDAPKTYARVMKFFVIACCFMFLIISLFLDFWQLLIASRFKEYAEGIHIVPVLAMASVFLGIYYNLSIWYKLTDKNMTGAYITLGGAAITIGLNIWWIPVFGYTGAAWATFFCYAFMMAMNYRLGQKYYPIPYPKKKLLAYLATAALCYLLHELIVRMIAPASPYYATVYYGTSLLFLGLFTLLTVRVEARELRRLPVIGKYFHRYG